MSGTTKSNVVVTLRNPLDYADTIRYTIIPTDSSLSQDWVVALKQLLQSGNLLEKNYCFMGFPNTARTLEYMCSQLNKHIKTINLFNSTGLWQQAGMATYIIEDYFTPDTVRFGEEYPIGGGRDDDCLGLRVKHDTMNRLHNYFEQLQGTVWGLSDYYKIADYATKYAIRQLNNLCHEIESLVLSQRKQCTLPEWVRPSQITTFLHADRHELTDAHRDGFNTNGYDRKFGHVYMHWTQIGKTLFEVFRDEGAPRLDSTTCEAINALRFYSGEFDVEWGNDVVYGDNLPWHDDEQDRFVQWLIDNDLSINDTQLSLGYLPLGYIDIESDFGIGDQVGIRNLLGKYLDIIQIEVDGVIGNFDYCWNDDDYEHTQIEMMRPGYDYSSIGR